MSEFDWALCRPTLEGHEEFSVVYGTTCSIETLTTGQGIGGKIFLCVLYLY